MNKIETLGSQVFSVPNTEEGRLFVKLCHKYLNNNHYRINKYYRAKNRKARYQEQFDAKARSDIPSPNVIQMNAPPMPYCDWTAVYFNKHANCVIQKRILKIKGNVRHEMVNKLY